MGSPPRPTRADLVAAAAERGWSMYELARWVEAQRDVTPVGESGPSAREGLRFRGSHALSTPSRELEKVEVVDHPAGEPQIEITTSFNTLTGVASPLPLVDVIRVRRAALQGDRRAADMLDILHHRMLSLLWRGWARHRPHVLEHRWASSSGGRLLARLTRGDDVRRARNRIRGARSASRLASTLRELLDAPVDIDQCIPRRQTIAPDQQLRLGTFGRLGTDTLLGDWAWEAGGRFMIRVGPVPKPIFERLGPEGDLHEAVRELVESWLDRPMSWAMEVVPSPDASVPARLASTGQTRTDLGTTLGRDTWLGAGSTTPLRYEMTQERA